MNISKYIGKTFPAGKTAGELGIDTSKKFILVHDIDAYFPPSEGKLHSLRFGKKYREGTIFTVEHANPKWDHATFYPTHTPRDESLSIEWSNLAYLEEEDEGAISRKGQKTTSATDIAEDHPTKTKPIVTPRVGDRWAITVQIISRDKSGDCMVTPVFDKGTMGHIWMASECFGDEATLVSRAPRFIRTLTKAEAEKMLSEKLGEDIEIG